MPEPKSEPPRDAARNAPPVVMYTKTWCPYCVMAKRLLVAKGVEVEEINVERDADALETMLERSGGRRTVPQIFIGAEHVGGYDDLAALERAGRLGALLTSGATSAT